MKFKKIAKVLLSCVLAGALLTGCGGEQAATDKPGNNFSGDVVKLGMIGRLNSSEEEMSNILTKLEEKTGANLTRHLPKFYDNLKAMQLGIESGEVSEISTYQSVANYLIKSNAKFEIVPDNALNKLVDSFCFAVRKDDAQLKADLSKVIEEMKADGTLDKLVKEYITDVDNQNIPKVEVPKIDGAQPLKVGVTGDLPPLDLILTDGAPAGFNTAILAEIGKRLNRNVELVQIESGARAAALQSKLIDVVFWVIVPFGNSDIPADIDKPEGLELSAPYFKDNVAHIRLKVDK